jgi:catechol 2,3-dioxygenase-like lactoylglutathione lyase family enzyme
LSMPTIGSASLHHYAVTVSDLDRSLAFYREALGAEIEWELAFSGAEVSETMRVPGSELRVASLRLGAGVLELFEFQRPEGRGFDRRSNDIGATHLGVEVADIDVAYERVKALGAVCYFPPKTADAGPIAGIRFFYFEDPDGLMVELLELP